jgi:4-aminobutyrate aminotransferase-like enzyme
MSKLLHYGAIWKTISRDNILHWQGDTSTFLKIELDRVSVEKPGLVKNVRGYGTHLGFDSDKPDSLQRWFYKTGF